MFVGQSGYASYVSYDNFNDQANAHIAVSYQDYEDYVLETRQNGVSYMLVKKVPEPTSLALFFIASFGLLRAWNKGNAV